MFSSARDAILALLLPTLCQICGRTVESWDDGIVCAECWSTADWSPTTTRCQKCDLPTNSDTLNYCGTCGPLRFAEARGCGPYAGAWRESVLWLKRHPQIAPRISASLNSGFRELARRHCIDSLLPIPLHPDRERTRGFNQATVIAESLSRSTGLPVDQASVVRTSATIRHRAGMDAAERASSLKRAFLVRAPRGVRGRGILIVDDLMTTGATANEVATVLSDAGASEVCVLTIARVISAPLWGKRLAQV